MIDRAWVDFWAGKYPTANDGGVLDDGGPRVREAFDRADLLTVGRWKSRRALPLLESNTDAMIDDVTRTAFSGPAPIAHRILMILRGVQVPMASALLTVWDPERFTVIDVRAKASLVAAGELEPMDGPPPYVDYLAVCNSIADSAAATSGHWIGRCMRRRVGRPVRERRSLLPPIVWTVVLCGVAGCALAEQPDPLLELNQACKDMGEAACTKMVEEMNAELDADRPSSPVQPVFSGGDVDCPDFSTHAEAQRYYEGQVGDPDGLDRDGDGLACETLP